MRIAFEGERGPKLLMSSLRLCPVVFGDLSLLEDEESSFNDGCESKEEDELDDNVDFSNKIKALEEVSKNESENEPRNYPSILS
jgi:hypothetical protein